MKTQTYYTAETEIDANVCDLTVNLQVNCAGAVNSSVGISNSLIRNDFYLMYVVRGMLNLKFDNKEETFSSGQFIIIKAGTPYSYWAEKNKDLYYLWIHFTGKEAEEVVEKYFLKTNTIIQTGVNGVLFDLWKKLFREFILNDCFFNTVSNNLLNQILAEFSRNTDLLDKQENILKSVTYIHENFYRELNVKELAEIEGLSESYYRVCFKKIIGVSPSQYITDKRLEAAATLLVNSNMGLKEICDHTGYSDPYYLGRLFKKKFGISPGKYRKHKCD